MTNIRTSTRTTGTYYVTCTRLLNQHFATVYDTASGLSVAHVRAWTRTGRDTKAAREILRLERLDRMRAGA